MTSTRLFRILVCALVICSLLINCSPIKAKAVAVEASIAIGLIAMMILASAGVVYTASTTNQIQAIGNSFQTHMYQWGTSAEKVDVVDAFFKGLHLYDPGSGDDDETPHDKQVRLARGILAGITAWVASLALGMIDIEDPDSVVSDVYSFSLVQNGVEKDFTCDKPFKIVTFLVGSSNNIRYFLFYSDSYIVINSSDGPLRLSNTYGSYYYNTSSYMVSFLESYDACWDLGSFGDNWSIDDIMSIVTNPSPNPIPSTYIGDIPEQLQNGELEPEDIPLPDINLEPYIEDGKLAPQKVIDTMSNLSTGALPYDQFLQQSTLPPEIDDGGTDTDSGTSSDTWQPPSNPGQFALDLTKYFPFCIPFDLYDLFTCLNADPVAPVIRWELPMPGGSTYPIELDLSPFNSVAQLLRRMQLLLFCVGLAIKTRDLIKG